MHHNPGIFYCIWSAMAIETTFMCYVHGRSEIIGLSLKPEAVKTWAFRMHVCNSVLNNLDIMWDSDTLMTGQTS